MKFEIGHKKNDSLLQGIEDIDKPLELGGNEDNLSWLETSTNENSTDYLEGIDQLELGSSPLLKSFANQGILEIIQKQAIGKQLHQPEMKLLWDFNRAFPDLSLKELEEATNDSRK